MKVGFFLVLRENVEHYLHASALVRDLQRQMRGVEIVQFSDMKTASVPGVSRVDRRDVGERPLLEQRWLHYSLCGTDDWLLIDTDVSIRNDVRGVFDDLMFDIALCDRDWKSTPQAEWMLQTMPFNTGVIFSRRVSFLQDVLAVWRDYPESIRANWMSEQRAVYDVVRRGRYRIKILPGEHYNYPPKHPTDAPVYAAMLHYKGNRKAWRSRDAYQVLGQA